MKAKYNPQFPDRLPLKVREYIGKTIEVTHARPVNGVNHYWSDLFFPGSSPIPETDLEFDEEQLDVYCHKCSTLCRTVYHLPGACV